MFSFSAGFRIVSRCVAIDDNKKPVLPPGHTAISPSPEFSCTDDAECYSPCCFFCASSAVFFGCNEATLSGGERRGEDDRASLSYLLKQHTHCEDF